jgi:twitching motility protein PilT
MTHTAGTGYQDFQHELADLINITIAEGASDLHFSAGYHPTVRVSGTLIPLVKKPKLTPEDALNFLSAMVSAEHKKKFIEQQELDYSYSHTDGTRFRGNAAYQRGLVTIALRLIPKAIRTFTELALPPVLETFAQRKQGFFLVVGPVGQGKSTTLAALVDYINSYRSEHIITIEDPIEYLHEPKQCIIHQREVGTDTENFHTALLSAFRQDVNVIMVGEMRGSDTISAAVTAAETGHLVLSTLHTNSAAQTIDRIIDTFPEQQQDQIRVQLAASLVGIFSQRLVPRIAGGMVPAYELLINSKAVSNMIREKRTHEVNTVIETGSEEGMISMNASLADLVRRGEITVEHAFQVAGDPRDLERML